MPWLMGQEVELRRQSQRWGAAESTDAAWLACLPLSSCAAWFLIGQGPGIWGSGTLASRDL